jgi:hypothetical protein
MAKDNGKNKGGSYSVSGFDLPPLFSYDPSILSELRASERGLKDIKQDTRTDLKQARQDRRTQLRDLAVDLRRGRRDIQREKGRGLRDIGYQRSDVKTSAARTQQDLGMRLDDIVRSFSQQGTRQFEAATGTLAAAAKARASNLAIAREPIDIERGRVTEDLSRDLGRLGVSADDLREDARIQATRLRKDSKHDKMLTKRDFRRFRRDGRTQVQRAEREQRIGQLDLIQQAIFGAQQQNPKWFNQHNYGK